MLLIEEILPELLAQNNCVIVPGFGGFVAKTQPAVIDFERQLMSPPYKSILFNRQLRADDGLLTHALSNRTGFRYGEAVEHIQEKVLQWNRTMNDGGRVEIERVGVFYKDKEGIVQFEQDRYFNLLLASYGLQTVRFTPVVEEIVTEKVGDSRQPVQDESSVEKALKTELKVVKPRKRPALRYAAASVLLPIAFYSIWIPVKTDVLQSGVVSLNDFNPFYKKQQGNYSPDSDRLPAMPSFNGDEEPNIESLPNELEVYSYRFAADKFIQVDLASDSEKSLDNQTPDAETVQAGSINYIVGCFASKANADNLIAKMKAEGLPAFIVDQQNGLHRVSAGAAFSEEAIQQIAESAQSLGYKGWILQ